jgi:hypothetical protein
MIIKTSSSCAAQLGYMEIEGQTASETIRFHDTGFLIGVRVFDPTRFSLTLAAPINR